MVSEDERYLGSDRWIHPITGDRTAVGYEEVIPRVRRNRKTSAYFCSFFETPSIRIARRRNVQKAQSLCTATGGGRTARQR